MPEEIGDSLVFGPDDIYDPIDTLRLIEGDTPGAASKPFGSLDSIESWLAPLESAAFAYLERDLADDTPCEPHTHDICDLALGILAATTTLCDLIAKNDAMGAVQAVLAVMRLASDPRVRPILYPRGRPKNSTAIPMDALPEVLEAAREYLSEYHDRVFDHDIAAHLDVNPRTISRYREKIKKNPRP